jgi:hypothetical protein
VQAGRSHGVEVRETHPEGLVLATLFVT